MNIFMTASRDALHGRGRSQNLVSKHTLPAALLAGMAVMALCYSAGSATAKPLTSCQIKHSQCSERCLMNNKDGGACIRRTCDVQNPGCGNSNKQPGSSTESSVKGKGGKSASVHEKKSPAAGASAPTREAASGNTGAKNNGQQKK